ncbi:hypothetical protein C8R41DRAFT_920075 [Lentinula lateritia]|uniref:Uncharacterized protein n=1 Tax=Lentinula lateritia TaxID=40482 RepID=A0ABQ8VF82_9AGAR|nr:hypothetical protein C8R41DRAFT_920075 [Lentinula lateritia]
MRFFETWQDARDILTGVNILRSSLAFAPPLVLYFSRSRKGLSVSATVKLSAQTTSSSQPTTVSFSRSVLKNKAIVDEAEKLLKDFKPVTYDVSKHIKVIVAFDAKAVSTAKETEEKIDVELGDLQATLANNEEAHPFQNFTVLDTGKAHPRSVVFELRMFRFRDYICMLKKLSHPYPSTLTIRSSECPPYPTQICHRLGWTSFPPLFCAAITSSTYLPSQYPLDDPVPEGFVSLLFAHLSLVTRKMHGPRLSGAKWERHKTVNFHENCEVVEFSRDEDESGKVFESDEDDYGNATEDDVDFFGEGKNEETPHDSYEDIELSVKSMPRASTSPLGIPKICLLL